MSIRENSAESGRSPGREIALNVGAVAGLVCVLAAVASFLFGIKPLIFRSGSMSPDIPTGALALSKVTPAADLEVGDVVSVPNEQGTRITHRVHEVVSSDGTSSVLILKGDANKDADISPYTVTEADRVFFSVPGLGYAVSWLSSPAAIFLGGALVGGVLVLAFGPGSKRKGDDDDDSDAGTGAPDTYRTIESPAVDHPHSATDLPTESFRTQGFSMRRLLPVRTFIGAGALGLAALLGMTVSTAAAFTDPASASTPFSSRSTFVPAPKYVGCSGDGGRKLYFKWVHLGPGYTYEVQTVGGYYATRPTPALPANKGDVITMTFDAYDDIYKIAKDVYIEVRSIRGGATGSSWTGEKIRAVGYLNLSCKGIHQSGPDQTASAGGEFAARRADPSSETVEATTTTDPMATSTAPTSTTTPGTSTATTTSGSRPATSTTTPSSTTAQTTPSTTETTTTTTNEPTAEESATSTATTTAGVPQLAGAKASPSGTYVAGKSGPKAVIQDSSGGEVFSKSVAGDAAVQWDSSEDALWIVDDGTIYRVTAGTWRAVPVDPESIAVPAKIAALIK
ncbi:hypothetical protein ACFTSD_05585 [Nocardiaceae bacterium NPDC056970]